MTVLANSADVKLVIFFLFVPENRIYILCKLLETICMKYQILFSERGKKKKYFEM